jgi:hypothetical protein
MINRPTRPILAISGRTRLRPDSVSLADMMTRHLLIPLRVAFFAHSHPMSGISLSSDPNLWVDLNL